MQKSENLLADIFENSAEERLDLETERATLAAAKAGDQGAKTRLMLAYSAALRNAVAGYTRSLAGQNRDQDQVEEVRAQVLVGFLEAIEAFQPEVHDRLAAVIGQHLQNAVSVAASSATSFHVPERSLKRFFGILRLAEGNVFEAVRIAPEHEMTVETFMSILAAVRDVDSFDAVDGNRSGAYTAQGGGFAEEDLWSRTDSTPLWDGAHADAEDRILVEAAFRAVDGLESEVVGLSYGFTDYEPVPDAEIGHRLGLSRAKAQRTRSAALGKMRVALGVVA